MDLTGAGRAALGPLSGGRTLPPGSWPGWVWVLLALAVGLGLLLLLPVTFTVRFAYRGTGGGEKVLFELGLLGRFKVWRYGVPPTRLVRGGPLRSIIDLVGRIRPGLPLGWPVDRPGSQAELPPATHPGAADRATPPPVSRPRSLGRATGLARSVVDIIWDLIHSAHWKSLSWVTTLGLPDAAATALTAGTLWMLKGNLAAVARRRLRLAPGQPDFDVRADFATKGFQSSLDGIAVLRVGHIMLALARWAVARSRQSNRDEPGRRSAWPSTPFKA